MIVSLSKRRLDGIYLTVFFLISSLPDFFVTIKRSINFSQTKYRRFCKIAIRVIFDREKKTGKKFIGYSGFFWIRQWFAGEVTTWLLLRHHLCAAPSLLSVLVGLFLDFEINGGLEYKREMKYVQNGGELLHFHLSLITQADRSRQ